MSHYVVVVIGDDPETQLEPFDENERVPKYLIGDVSEDDKQRFMEHYQKEKPKETEGKTFEEVFKKFGKEWGGGWQIDKDGVLREYSTYNPNSKWDWYELGGRWKGFFLLKGGSRDDCAMVKDIDFEQMERETRQRAEAHYDKVMAVIGKHRPNKPWKHYMDSVAAGVRTIDKARDLYWAQARCVAYKEGKVGGGFFDSPDDFLCTRQEYSDNAAAGAGTPYAVIKDSEWFAKGEMGWWGMSRDAMTDFEWHTKFRELIQGLPEDTMLWAYDLHI